MFSLIKKDRGSAPALSTLWVAETKTKDLCDTKIRRIISFHGKVLLPVKRAGGFLISVLSFREELVSGTLVFLYFRHLEISK